MQRSMTMRRVQEVISSRGQPGQNGGMPDDPRLVACLAAALLTLAGAGLARFAALPRLGAAALPLAVFLGFTLIIGGVQASPRQLGERLPMLALLLLGPALLAAWRPRRALGWVMLAVAALLAGWWMSGGALHGPDLGRAMPVLVLVALGAGLASLALRAAWLGAVLPLGLTAMLLQAAPPGPWAELGLVLGAAGLTSLAYGRSMPMAGWRALGPAMAALAAGPVIARGQPQDWALALSLAAAAAVAAAPLPPLARLGLATAITLGAALAFGLW